MVSTGECSMHVEWQGDYKMLGEDMKQDFERELTNLGFDPGNFLVEVRREADVKGAGGPPGIKYDVYITDVAHPDRETRKLHGGDGENWIEQFRKTVLSRR